MWKKHKYYIIAAFIVLALMLMEVYSPKPINWFESYSQYDKIPYGNNILFTELPSLFSQEIVTVDGSLQEGIKTNPLAPNYLILNNRFFPEEQDLEALLNFVEQGNRAMLISNQVHQQLLDTLGLDIIQTFSVKLGDSLLMSLPHQKDAYTFYTRARMLLTSFESKNDSTVTPLGYVADSLSNFVKVPFGEGEFYLHCNPLVFTNYHMLKNDNHRYISAVLSYLPDQNLVWDEHYKNRNQAIQKSHLSVVVATPGLRQALYISMLALLVFMAFALKRKQRIIPPAVSKSNDTLNFVRTIGQLYYNENNNKDIGMKQISFFMQHVRKHFHIYHTQLDDTFCALLHKQSGVELKEIKKLVTNFKIITGVPDVTDERLIEQNQQIESFYKKTRYNG